MKQKTNITLQIAYTVLLIYSAVVQGMAGNWNRVVVCAIGILIGTMAFSHFRDMEDLVNSCESKDNDSRD